jgi:serine/threonine-protein kinase HipA
MSVNGKFDGITRDDLMAVARRFGVVGARDALVQLREAVGQWRELAGLAGLPESEASAVAKDHRPM